MESTVITEKFFRVRENLKKIDFVLKNSGITLELIQKAAIVSKKNPYHNFGHEIGATEQGIRLAQAEERSIEEVNLIALALLFHDADHRGIVQFYDEMHAIELASTILISSDTKMIGEHNSVLTKMRELILGTIFPDGRAKHTNPMVWIIQDADLAHLGLGPIYWLWASMGLVDEFNRNRSDALTPENFIHFEQEKFVKFLAGLSGTGKIYLSHGAQKIFSDPLKDVEIIKNYPSRVIQYAYDVRREDVTLEEFTDHINSLLS